MSDPEEAGIYQIENHQLVQGQVIGSGNTVHQYFGPLNAASTGHAASSLSGEGGRDSNDQAPTHELRNEPV